MMIGKKKQPTKRITHQFAIVASCFNDYITKRLLKGCLIELKRLGVPSSYITTVWVPGAFEIPVTALKLAQKKNIDGVICLGAVIRGETIHFELVAQNAARGILEASLATQKPIIFGVLSTETVEQAYRRSEDKGDNKGRDAARAVVDMANLFRKF
jgi:6,7-dimethyl-8-ribityllumazine synthase